MINFKLYFLVFFFTLSACETELSLNSSVDQTSLVVEGYIQQNFPAVVFLTTTQGYFDVLDSNFLSEVSVSDANITITRNDNIQHSLTYIDNNFLDTLNIFSELPFEGLYIDLEYKEDDFSQIGYTYSLQIEWRGKIITSKTSIPELYPIDSVWVQSKEDNVSDNYKHYIWAQFNDPDTLGNGITAYFKKTSNEKKDSLFVPCAISVRNDQLVNGENFPARFARSGRADEEDGVFLPFYSDRNIDGQIKERDIVILRINHVNSDTYKFWRSVERSKNSSGNPFSEPVNLNSNINGGIGIWGGYGASYYYIPIVPDTVIYDKYEDLTLFDLF